MRAFLTELSRWRSRRAVVALVLAMLAFTFVVLAAIVYETRPFDAAEVARAEQRFEREQADSAPQIAECRADPEQFFGGPVPASECEFLAPQLENYLTRPALDLAETVRVTAPGIGILLGAVAVLVGATFVGADWGSGSMTNQLLFRPRRSRVWASKAAAVVVGTTLAAAVAVVGFWAALLAVAAARDVPVTDPLWRGITLTSLRSLALVAAAALGGFAITTWLRRTSGAIGVLFGTTVVVELLALVLPFERMGRWSLLNNLRAFIGNGTEVYDDRACTGAFADGCDYYFTLTLTHGAVYLAVLLLLAVAVSLWSFTRRDVL